MAIISLAGASTWAGDASNNGKVALYDASGRLLLPVATGEYAAKIEIRQTSAAAAGVTVWNMRGPPSLKAYVKRIYGSVVFDGVGAAGSTLRYGFYRGAGAASPTLGATILASKKLSTFQAATVADLRSDLTGVGLTTTGITYDADPFMVVAVPISLTNGNARFDFWVERPFQLDSPYVLAASDHLAIRLQTVAAVIGLGIYGVVEWSER